MMCCAEHGCQQYGGKSEGGGGLVMCRRDMMCCVNRGCQQYGGNSSGSGGGGGGALVVTLIT